jgi:hypothetical protein
VSSELDRSGRTRPGETTALNDWSIRYGLPAQVVGLLARGRILEHTGHAAAAEELVRLCETREGRTRMLSLAAVREALREPQGGVEGNVWTTQDMLAFIRGGTVPAWLGVEFEASQRLDAELARHTKIDFHTMSAPVVRPRAEPRPPRGTPRARSPRRPVTASRTRSTTAHGPAGSSSDDDPHDLARQAVAA